jgi:hypothetical protein
MGPLLIPSDHLVIEGTPGMVINTGDLFFLGLRLGGLVPRLCGLSVAVVAMGVFADLGLARDRDIRVE